MDNLKTIHSFLENSARKFPDKEALVFEDQRFTYSEVNILANKVRDFLFSKYNKSDRIAVMIDNSIDFVITYFGILKAGCCAVLFSPVVSDKNFIFQIQNSGAKCIFTQEKYKQRISRTGIDKIINVFNWSEDSIAEIDNKESPLVKEDDLCSLIYTSGTTSLPKGVELRHRNVVEASKNIVEFLKNDESDIYLSVLPLSHSFGLGHVHISFMMGGKVVIEKNAINLKRIITRINEEKATFFAAVPLTLKLLADSFFDELSTCATLRRIVTNSGPIQPETTKKILEAIPNNNFYTYYGLTEASRSSFMWFNKHKNKLTSVGPPTPNVKIEIRDEGKVIPTNKLGEVCIAGKHVVERYWQNEEASKTIADGWVYTGDIGHFDEEGLLYIVGRKDDIINISGEKVTPKEIEKAILQLEGVQEVAVIGKTNSGKDIVKAFVIPRLGHKTTEEEVISICKKSLEPYKVPQEIEFVKDLPKTDTGKIKRHLLRQEEDAGKIFDSSTNKMLNLLPKITLPKQVYFGKNSLSSLKCIKKKKLLVLIGGFTDEKFGQELRELLKENTYNFIVHKGEPSLNDCEKLKTLISKENPDLLIGIGGGSVIDLIKAAKANSDIPLIIIPTLIGSGSETTRFSLLLDENKNKKVIDNLNIVPDIVIFHPKFVEAIPRNTLINTAIDGFAHAMEGLVSKYSNEFVKLLGCSVVDEYYECLTEISEKNKIDTGNIEKLQYLGFLSGLIQGTASVGLMHGLAHNLGPMFNVGHAKSISTFFIPVLKHNAKNSDCYKILDKCRNFKSNDFIEKIEKLFSDLKVESFNHTQIDSTKLPELAKKVKLDICTKSNPHNVSEEDIFSILGGNQDGN